MTYRGVVTVIARRELLARPEGLWAQSPSNARRSAALAYGDRHARRVSPAGDRGIKGLFGAIGRLVENRPHRSRRLP